MHRGWTIVASCVLVLAAAPDVVRAAGGSENVFLVVNSRSWASLTLANHYTALRRLPWSNVLHLDWPGGNEEIDVAVFRDRILTPALAAIEARGLADQIDYLVYSSDFPWAVDFQDFTIGQEIPPQFAPTGSLTSLTFFWPQVLAGNPNLAQLQANRYFRRAEGGAAPRSQGFRAWYGWDASGELCEAGGEHYLLATMLGVTSGRGTSVSESVRYLEAAAAADGTRPRGTVYYVKNSNIRSTTRDGAYEAAAEALAELGVAAEVIEGSLPLGKDDVQGAMLGISDFDWPDAKSTILPGAIVEHLTSLGGVLRERGGQTPLTELLRHGAAGASGTVCEPYAIVEKFPSPWIHVHYARGCTLAEAFYQSVAGPFQLLIVGDPLCRPWARIPKVGVNGLVPGDTVRGTLSLLPTFEAPTGSRIDRFEWFMDGVRRGTGRPEDRFAIDTTLLADGYHELRIVALEAAPIETPGSLVLPIMVDNRGRSVKVSASEGPRLHWGQPVEFQVDAAGATAVVIAQGMRRLGSRAGANGTFTIDPRLLGQGPVAVQAIALGAGGADEVMFSQPLEFAVEPAEYLSAPDAPDDSELTPGLTLTRSDGSTEMVEETTGDWLGEVGVEDGADFVLSGWFHVGADDVYQFQLRHLGALALVVDGETLYDAAGSDNTRQYVAVGLEEGEHLVEVRATRQGESQIDVRFGGRGTRRLSSRWFRSKKDSE